MMPAPMTMTVYVVSHEGQYTVGVDVAILIEVTCAGPPGHIGIFADSRVARAGRSYPLAECSSSSFSLIAPGGPQRPAGDFFRHAVQSPSSGQRGAFNVSGNAQLPPSRHRYPNR